MIFKSGKVSAQWDTWCYFHGGTYYLFYLITESSPGEGFGVATSGDGVHWTDHGWAIKASDQMVRFLGTGSVWPDPKYAGRFLCNYSEHRLDEEGKLRQCILFAWSEDLINWTKFGSEHIFRVDERYYERYGRWDCIFAIARPEGGYLGTWTATPLGRAGKSGGIGFGWSADGLRWQALAPAEIIPDADESGAMIVAGGRMHAMFGIFGHDSGAGMQAYVAERAEGPYRLAQKNACLLQADGAYFSRYFETPAGVLVNHHAMDGRKNSNGRPATYLAPFKQFSVDAEGTQRWKWWPGNEALKGRPLPPCGKCDVQQGVIFEGVLQPDASKGYADLLVEADNLCFAIRLAANAEVEVRRCDPESNAWTRLQIAGRDMQTAGTGRFRLLARRGMLEFYIDDYFMECCKLGCPAANYIRCMFPEKSAGAIRHAWQMDLGAG